MGAGGVGSDVFAFFLWDIFMDNSLVYYWAQRFIPGGAIGKLHGKVNARRTTK